ncbi:copper resistance protein CopC [Nocardioides panacihumi]|uniref:Copper resistance protein CopC n=1 Tax=Nocardioides panacihumi TaxID=400774 RepID=A0ABN2RX07_9ACTN
MDDSLGPAEALAARETHLARTRRRRRSRILAVRTALGTVVSAVLLLLTGGPAAAHAELESSDPAPDTVLTTAPRIVSLRFSEDVSAPAGAVRVFAPDGSRVDSGRVETDGGRVTVGVGASARGTYLVAWRVVSDDSHPVSGAFTFSVGVASAVPTGQAQATDRGLQVGLGIGRWVGYVGSALLVGGLAFLCWCWPAGWTTRRARRIVLGGAVLLVVASIGSLIIKGPLDAGLGWGSLGRGELAREVLATTYGRATLSRGLLALLLGLLVVGRSRLSTRELGGYGALLGACIAVSFALAGHAAAGDLRGLALLSESVHVLAMSVWLGGLVVLVAGSVWRQPDARRVVLRFSSVALASVTTLVVTGLFQTWRQVGTLAALWPTTYGRELTVKVCLVLMVIGVAAAGRQLLRRRDGLALLRRSVVAETVIVLAVLGVTSALVASEPARTAYRATVVATLSLAGDAVRVSAVPAGDRRSRLQVDVVGADGRPVAAADVRATLTLRAESIGPLPVALQIAGPGHRRALVSVPTVGTWRLAVTVDGETGYVSLPIR